MDQRALVARAGQGDHDAFAVLATAAASRLDAAARLILRDPELARDAVQNTLVRAWRDLPGLRDPDRFDAWLHRLLVNACRDQVRRRNRRPLEVDIPNLERAAPGDDMARLADRDEIERAFLELSVEHRAVLVLTHYLGLSGPEVAAILRIPPGTVHSRLHYGSQAMRAALSRPPMLSTTAPEPGR